MFYTHKRWFCLPALLAGCLLGLGLAFLLPGCDSEREPPLRIGTNVWPGYEPLYLARDLGHYNETPVNLIEFTSASSVIHALRNGMIEGATLTLDEVLTLLSDGFDLKVILAPDIHRSVT
jgi:NitT/TauT family transport system substrate-binding protein